MLALVEPKLANFIARSYQKRQSVTGNRGPSWREFLDQLETWLLQRVKQVYFELLKQQPKLMPQLRPKLASELPSATRQVKQSIKLWLV